MNKKGLVKNGGQMRNRALLVAAILVLSLAICGLSSAAEELVNDSRKTAVAVRITFRSSVRITGHGREFDTVEPSSGLSDVFVFSGGELRRNRTFEVRWSPASRAIKSVEWLEVLSAEQQQEMEEIRGCSCILSPADSLQSRLNNAYDGIEICLEPGSYMLSGYIISLAYDITIRGIHQAGGGVAQITAQKYDDIVLAFHENTLRLENLSFGAGIVELMSRGTSTLTIESCDLPSLIVNVRGTAVASIVDTSLGVVLAVEGAEVTLTNCTIGAAETSLYAGILAGEDALVSVFDSIIQNNNIGVSAGDNSVVRLIRSEIVNCDTDIQERDSGRVEIEKGPDVADVRIECIVYDGLVPSKESDEYVQITNFGTASQNLLGWTLEDADPDDYANGQKFSFTDSFVLEPGQSIRVYTNEVHPEWGGFSFGRGSGVWNNTTPDTALLLDGAHGIGQEIDRCTYSLCGEGCCSTCAED